MEIPECDPSVYDRSEGGYDADRSGAACPGQALECPFHNRRRGSCRPWYAAPHRRYYRQRLQFDGLASGSSHEFPRSVLALGYLIAIVVSLCILLCPENLNVLNAKYFSQAILIASVIFWQHVRRASMGQFYRRG